MDTLRMDKLRIDKWLWAARFYKTRTLAAEEIDKNRITVNGQTVKPSRDIHIGDTVGLSQGSVRRTVVVQGLSAQRGPAPIAQALYAETPESIALREAQAEQRRLAPEPAHAISQTRQGRPTKRDRRDLGRLNESPRDVPDWNDRWSASLD
jgi:ribosome-associated heat shock protein Hsp15